MNTLLHTTLLGLMLTVQAAGAQTAVKAPMDTETPRLNLNLPRSTWQSVPVQPSVDLAPGRTDYPQRMPYGSGYESRQQKHTAAGLRSSTVNGRGSGRGR